MNHKLGIATIAVGIALALGACGTIGSAGSAQANPPNSANAAPSGNGGTGGTGGATQGQRNPGLMGQVVTVNGSTITVQNQRQGGTTTVTLTDSTQIFKQATVDLASVPVGKTLSATGTQSGDVFTATQIRISDANANGPGGGAPGANGPGGQGGRGGNSNGGGAPGANSGAPQTNGTAQPAREPGSRLFGTVEQVSGDTITVKKADASTVQIKLATNGQITEQVAGTAADITTGVQITVRGQRADTTMTATQINVLPAMTQQP